MSFNAFKKIFRVKIIHFLCVRDGVGDRVVGVSSLHEQFRVRDWQLRMRSAVCVCVCVCVCMYVSVDSMGKEESCKAGVWIS